MISSSEHLFTLLHHKRTKVAFKQCLSLRKHTYWGLLNVDYFMYFYIKLLSKNESVRWQHFLFIYLLKRERVRGGGERGGHDLLFHVLMHSLVASCMCPDQGPNPQPWCRVGWHCNQLSYPASACFLLFKQSSIKNLSERIIDGTFYILPWSKSTEFIEVHNQLNKSAKNNNTWQVKFHLNKHHTDWAIPEGQRGDVEGRQKFF